MEGVEKHKTKIKNPLKGLHNAYKLAEERISKLVDPYRLYDLKNKEKKSIKKKHLKEIWDIMHVSHVYNGWERRGKNYSK